MGLPVPSVTQVLRASGYVSFYRDLTEKIAEGELGAADGVYALIQRGQRLAAARRRGGDVHNLMHFVLEDDLDDESVDERYRGYLESGKRYIDLYVKEMFRAECRVWSLRHGYAGTLDLLGVHADGYISIWDWATGDPADVSKDLQTAAYLCAALEMANGDKELGQQIRSRGAVVRRRSVRLYRDGRIGKETPYTDPRDATNFLNALSLVHDQGCRPSPIQAWDDER